MNCYTYRDIVAQCQPEPGQSIISFEYTDPINSAPMLTKVKLLDNALMCPMCGAATDYLIVSARGLKCGWCNSTPAQRRKAKGGR